MQHFNSFLQHCNIETLYSKMAHTNRTKFHDKPQFFSYYKRSVVPDNILVATLAHRLDLFLHQNEFNTQNTARGYYTLICKLLVSSLLSSKTNSGKMKTIWNTRINMTWINHLCKNACFRRNSVFCCFNLQWRNFCVFLGTNFNFSHPLWVALYLIVRTEG